MRPTHLLTRLSARMLRRLGAAMLLPVALGVQAAPLAASDLAPPKGALVIIGGNLRAETADVWQRIVQLAGGPGARIAVLPSAAADPARSGEAIVARLNQYGAAAFLVPLAVRLEGSDFRKVADDAVQADAVRGAGGVFFAGGDQARITQALVREDGSRSAVLDAVWELYRRGGVVAGSSAGAAIMSSTMFYAPNTVFATLRLGVTDGREIAPGLGFIGDDIFVDQHLLVRGRFARMIPAMLKKGYKLGLGIDENTAMVIDSRRRVEILGQRGALLIDLTRASTDPASTAFNVSNARISYLDRGDRYDLARHIFIPSDDKRGGKLAALHSELRHPVFSPDILGANAVIELMENLVNNRRSEAIGIAMSGPGALPELGFEFTFSKTADSVAYVSSVSSVSSMSSVSSLSSTPAAPPLPPVYSILNLRLDIRPLEVQRSGAAASP